MTGAILEYARGLAVVKSFGESGASMDSVKKAVADSRRIHLKIEWGYLPANALHLLALKCGSVGLALAASLMCLNGQMDFSVALVFIFFSFSIFASLEPISDSAHTLSVINDAMDQLDALRGEHLIDADGKDIPLTHYDIEFRHVDFGYDSRQILKDVSFTIPEKTSTAIVSPSGSGKTTLCFAVQRAEDLLGEIKGIVLALLIGQTRIRFQIRQGDGTAACKRIGRTDKYMRFCHKKPRKFEVVFPQRLADHRLVKTVQIQHANLAPKLRHILNQLIRLRLADTEIVLFSAVLTDQIDKRLNGKGIVLGGDAELLFQVFHVLSYP